jgi:hypothetical protein
MPSVEETLKRLAMTFTVKDIMTSRGDLVCAHDLDHARTVSAQNADFDVIPIRVNERLIGYFERNPGHARDITANDLISDGTSLLDVVEIFEKRKFCFVLSHEHVAGYVHFSDLNHHLVKLTFYVLLEAVERMALGIVEKDDRELLKTKLNHPQRFAQIEALYKRGGEASRGLLSYLNISDLLRLAINSGVIKAEESVIYAIKRTRDGAAHVSENLVNSSDGVKELALVKRECLRILGNQQQVAASR